MKFDLWDVIGGVSVALLYGGIGALTDWAWTSIGFGVVGLAAYVAREVEVATRGRG